MPTFIDSLVVGLRLDPKQFEEGQKRASEAFAKTKTEAVKSGKAIEESSDKAADAINRISRRVLELFAIFTGSRALSDFIGKLDTMDASLGRLSSNLGVSPQWMYAWEAAAQQVGGSATATATTIDRLSQSLYEFHTQGRLPGGNQAFGWLTSLGGNVSMKDLPSYISSLAASLQKIYQSKASNQGPNVAFNLAKQLGVDEGTFNLMVKYGPKITAHIKEMQKLAPSNQAIAEAQKLQEQWVTLQLKAIELGNAIFEKLGGPISQIITKMQTWIDKNHDWIQSKFVNTISSFAADLPKFAKDIDDVSKAFGGWANVAWGLVAAFAALKALQVTALVATIAAAFAGGGAAAGVGAGAVGAAGGGMAILGGLTAGGALAAILGLLGLGAAIKYGGSHVRSDPHSGNRGVIGNYIDRHLVTPTDRLSAHADALWGGTTVDGRPVSKSNPMPTTSVDDQNKPEGFWSKVGDAIGGIFGLNGAGDKTPPTPTTSQKISGGNFNGTNSALAQDIITTFRSAGIDPTIALAVANHEGLRGWNPKTGRTGDGGSSFSQFQLHYGGINPLMRNKGLGDVFTEQTGLDARDPKNAHAVNEWVAQWVRKHGWGAWMGAKAAGITGFMGVGPLPKASALSNVGATHTATTSNTSNEAHIHEVHVHTQATDADGISSEIPRSLKRTMMAGLTNYGLA